MLALHLFISNTFVLVRLRKGIAMNDIRDYETATMVVEKDRILLLFRYKRNADEMLTILKHIAAARGFVTMLDMFVLVGIHQGLWLRMNYDSLAENCISASECAKMAVKFSQHFSEYSIIEITKDMITKTPNALI